VPASGSLTQFANQKISIATACQWAGMRVFEGEGERKVRCPFGDVAHADGGVEASFRMYEEDNSAYCFACSKYWSPVGLMSEFWDCTRAEAAERMCKTAGITPPDWRERWEELQHPVPPDTASLAEALKRWCSRIYGPLWGVDQFEPRLAVPLMACLGVLPLVSSGQEADIWLHGCKLAMLPLLQEQGDERK
jgi:hypothetical protein